MKAHSRMLSWSFAVLGDISQGCGVGNQSSDGYVWYVQ